MSRWRQPEGDTPPADTYRVELPDGTPVASFRYMSDAIHLANQQHYAKHDCRVVTATRQTCPECGWVRAIEAFIPTNERYLPKHENCWNCRHNEPEPIELTDDEQ